MGELLFRFLSGTKFLNWGTICTIKTGIVDGLNRQQLSEMVNIEHTDFRNQTIYSRRIRKCKRLESLTHSPYYPF
jgi:hypothetical protein